MFQSFICALLIQAFISKKRSQSLRAHSHIILAYTLTPNL